MYRTLIKILIGHREKLRKHKYKSNIEKTKDHVQTYFN